MNSRVGSRTQKGLPSYPYSQITWQDPPNKDPVFFTTVAICYIACCRARSGALHPFGEHSGMANIEITGI